jgi:solute:Na+ symporter, SSS family
MSSFHFLDYLVLAGYLIAVVVLGKIASRGASNQEGYFLAGRSLGRLYQFFLNFGNATDANAAVSTASVVYQQGVSGVWLAFQMIFLNPYYWFMNAWFRRVRLTTMADLFEDRLGSRSLATFYASFQIFAAVVVTIGYGNLIAYKISASLASKPEIEWTASEAQSVSEYRELKQLEGKNTAATITETEKGRLGVLRERDARGELRSFITTLEPWSFYIVYTVIVGAYIVMGGMAATALNEVLQSALIIVFSAILIPTGLQAIGGWSALGEKVPQVAFNLLGSSGKTDITGWTLAAILVVALFQINGIPGNMAVSGSAKNEFAARLGAVSGTFGKRILTIMWAFAGLIAIALFSGSDTLSDPDLVWGTMSRHLLGPGMLGLMLAGVLAANMSTIAAQTMAVSALYVRNIHRLFRPGMKDGEAILAGQWAIAVVLIIGIFAATTMNSVFSAVQLMLTINVPFGISVALMFFWRRLTPTAVWLAVILSALSNVIVPMVAPKFDSVRTHPALMVRAVDENGRFSPVYFERVARVKVDDETSPLRGDGRFHCELFLLNKIGVDVVQLSPSGRFAARFFFDALLPLVILLVVSPFTRAPAKNIVDQFFGKMKTPVGATPVDEIRAMEETRRNPNRFENLKLFPRSAWEFTRWDRVDTIGFVCSCLVTGGIIALFWALLRWAQGSA